MGVLTGATSFFRGLLGLGTAGAKGAVGVGQIVGGAGQILLPAARAPGAVARGAQATGRAILAGARAPGVQRALPLVGAAGAGAIIGGTLLDDVAPDVAMTLRQRGIDPATLGRPRRPKAPELVFDPISGATFRRVKKRRAKGITANQLKGFDMVRDLLHSVGMEPRKPTAKKRRKKRR